VIHNLSWFDPQSDSKRVSRIPEFYGNWYIGYRHVLHDYGRCAIVSSHHWIGLPLFVDVGLPEILKSFMVYIWGLTAIQHYIPFYS
jgi:hypothetical protein